jgi:hypothetical protein
VFYAFLNKTLEKLMNCKFLPKIFTISRRKPEIPRLTGAAEGLSPAPNAFLTEDRLARYL